MMPRLQTDIRVTATNEETELTLEAVAATEPSLVKTSDSAAVKNLSAATPVKRQKPYRTPVLTVYGTVETLTKTVTLSGGLDGGSGGMSRTH